ncbi:MAG TPA: adenylate/guanylate cyclase domain-containing protein [Anaerolineales bacterium]|nr:adenylate/guanylate cyclase domain-containing protein [Anaerolineales bacterium]
MMGTLPSGTVTFLFTDIEGSTQLWEKYPQEMRTALARHDEILRETIASHHGLIIKTTGDGIHAVFEKALDAVQATLSIQRAISMCRFFSEPGVSLSVRMGLHTGEAELRGNDYYGQVLNRAARIMSVAHGGQIVLSGITTEVIRDQLPVNMGIYDLGEHLLKDLSRPEHLYQLTAPDLLQEFPALKTLSMLADNLPAPLTSFIGREKELAEAIALVRSARLVTLTGSGGTGKSRLSVEIARQERASFPHGVWLIELAPLADASQIIPAIAQTFHQQEHPFGPLETMVLDYLRDKKLLLILDNCEHLIEACARLAGDLLQQCAGLKILASSREALGIAGEITYHTPSLADTEATRLFVERAQSANPNFHITDSNASSISQICSRLDGIPLAIELAAARVKLLSPEQIAARLDDRFRLLVGGSRTALPRQQTLRALIDWSYDLLSEEEKSLFRSASVFVGGWTLEALDAVADDPSAFEHLEQLVNKSLVITEERGHAMRYFMLETIRQYARERLFEAKESPAARDRHFLYFDNLAENIWKVFRTDTIHTWRNQADDETDNLRAAVEWGLENDAEKAIRLAANFCILTGWMGSRMEDGLTLCRTAIDRVRSLPPVNEGAAIDRQRSLARALFAQGMVGMSHGNIPVVLRDFQDAIAAARAAGDRRLLGYSLEMFFTATRFLNTPGGEAAAEEGFKIFTKELHDPWGLSLAYQNRARIAEERGDLSEKQVYLAKFKELIQQAPFSLQAGFFYLGTGLNERIHGNFEAAKSSFEEGLHVFRTLRNWNFQIIMTSELGHTARHMGKIGEAKNIYRETLKGWQNMGNRAAIANQLECFAFIALSEEDPQLSVRLLGAAETLRHTIQAPMADYEKVEYDGTLARLRNMLSEEEFHSAWSEGQSLSMEQAIELALNS